MKSTENFGFLKPEPSDTYNIEHQNENWDKTDGVFNELSNPEYDVAEKMEELVSGESYKTAFGKMELAVKNVISIIKLLGSTDISKIEDGTVTGILSVLNTNVTNAQSTADSAITPMGNYSGNIDELKEGIGIGGLYFISTVSGNAAYCTGTFPLNTSGNPWSYYHLLILQTSTANMIQIAIPYVQNMTGNQVSNNPIFIRSRVGSNNSGNYTDWSKLPSISDLTGAISTLVTNNLNANIVPISNASGKLVSSNITSTELGYLSGLVENVQKQLNRSKSKGNNQSTSISNIDNLRGVDYCGGYWIQASLSEGNHPFGDDGHYYLFVPSEFNGSVQIAFKYSDCRIRARIYTNSQWCPWTVAGISEGGTGATNAITARTNLGIYDLAIDFHTMVSADSSLTTWNKLFVYVWNTYMVPNDKPYETVSSWIVNNTSDSANRHTAVAAELSTAYSNLTGSSFTYANVTFERVNQRGAMIVTVYPLDANPCMKCTLVSGDGGFRTKTDYTNFYNSGWYIDGNKVRPSMLTNLGSTSAAYVMQSSPRPGVTGTLGVANGGTGAATAAAARTNLGLGTAATCSHTTNAPSSGSTALITSGAVYSALAGKFSILGGNVTGLTNFKDHVYIDDLLDMINQYAYINFRDSGRIKCTYGCYIGSDGAEPIQGEKGSFRFISDAFAPCTDATQKLGTSSFKWAQLYASTTTISTSDRNLKDNIAELTDIHKKLFMELIPVSFTFKDGESGRTHIGFISQDVEKAMEELGMTSLDFAGFCKDVKMTFEYIYEDVLDEDGNVVLDEDGNPKQNRSAIDIPDLDENGNEQYIYSLRYEEFIGLISYVLQDSVNRLDSIEKRLENAGL